MFRFAALPALVFAFAFFEIPARADAPKILIDGIAARTDVPAISVNGHVLVPLRGVFERFGAAVDFDAKRNVAVARRAGVTVEVAIGSPDAWVNDRHVSLDVPAREFGGRVEVPLRFVAQALGVSVDYDDLTNTVVIVSGFKQGNFVAAGSGAPSAASPAYGVPSVQTAQAQAPTIDEERPSPNSLVGSQYPQIYARFASGGAQVDPGSVRITVDDVDVSNSATISSAYVAYTPATPLDSGTHRVEVTGQSTDGAQFDEQWSFRIDEGTSTGYVSSMIGFAPSSFGIQGFGFSPPGFSVFAPGPQFFVEDEPIVIVFFSPFFPNGSGFFTISGFPGQFSMTPWLGCPGFFFGVVTVPPGVFDPDAVVAAHFLTLDGRKVLVHATAPLRIDGTRRSLPSDVRFAVRARLMNRPATPRMLVAFNRVTPAARAVPIARASMTAARRLSLGSAPVPIARRPAPTALERPVIAMPLTRAPPQPARPIVIVPARLPTPIVPAPQPILPKPIPHL